MRKKVKNLSPDAPLLHENHKRPVTRRDFLAQGFMTGAATIAGPSLFSLFANPRAAEAALSPDLEALKTSCGISTQGAGKIPFICFDLAGGANIAGSNVLAGQQGGQEDALSTGGYSKLGLPGDMLPSMVDPNAQIPGSTFTDRTLGIAFHSDSSFLRGIMSKVSPATAANINGAIIPARSDNDTGNNPHNPMYGIAKAGAGGNGADGELLTLIGSRSSESGGNSMAPAALIDAEIRPTKVDRPSDTTGLVDTGKLVGLLDQGDAVAVLESIQRISDKKLGRVSTKLNQIPQGEVITRDALIKELINCGYVKTADIVDRYGDPSALDARPQNTTLPAPDGDPLIGQIFSQGEFDGDGEFRKTASVMKLVVNGYAGAGTVTMGGYDYHTGDRAVGEIRDFRAGVCMGACLEYAAMVGVPLMLYVCSDGSVASNGTLDNSQNGRGKGVWTGDNSSTAASMFLVYNPGGRPQLFTGDSFSADQHQQLGYYSANASVSTIATPAANNVNILVDTVLLNYMALHNEQNLFSSVFPGQGVGNSTLIDRMTAFNPICNGIITNPI